MWTRPNSSDQDQDQDQNNKNQDHNQSNKTKTKTTGSKPLGVLNFQVSKRHHWSPLYVMFQAQNSETINSTWKVSLSFKIIMMTHNTTPDLQDQDQDRFFFGHRPVLS